MDVFPPPLNLECLPITFVCLLILSQTSLFWLYWIRAYQLFDCFGCGLISCLIVLDVGLSAVMGVYILWMVLFIDELTLCISLGRQQLKKCSVYFTPVNAVVKLLCLLLVFWYHDDLNFLNGIIHLRNCPLSFSWISRRKLQSWSANIIEPGQTAQKCRLAWFNIGGKG